MAESPPHVSASRGVSHAAGPPRVDSTEAAKPEFTECKTETGVSRGWFYRGNVSPMTQVSFLMAGRLHQASECSFLLPCCCLCLQTSLKFSTCSPV